MPLKSCLDHAPTMLWCTQVDIAAQPHFEDQQPQFGAARQPGRAPPPTQPGAAGGTTTGPTLKAPLLHRLTSLRMRNWGSAGDLGSCPCPKRWLVRRISPVTAGVKRGLAGRPSSTRILTGMSKSALDLPVGGCSSPWLFKHPAMPPDAYVTLLTELRTSCASISLKPADSHGRFPKRAQR